MRRQPSVAEPYPDCPGSPHHLKSAGTGILRAGRIRGTVSKAGFQRRIGALSPARRRRREDADSRMGLAVSAEGPRGLARADRGAATSRKGQSFGDKRAVFAPARALPALRARATLRGRAGGNEPGVIRPPRCGRLAQLGERCVRNAEVGGSIPPPSTKFLNISCPALVRRRVNADGTVLGILPTAG